MSTASGGPQGWSPGAAPTPLSDRLLERRAIRTKARLVLYAVGLMGSEFWDSGSGGESGYSTSNDFELGGGLGVGFRYNFTRAFGIQARLLGLLDNADSFGLSNGGSGSAQWDEQVVGISVLGELGVRLGPVSDSVPWYFGVLVGAGGRALSGDATCSVISGATSTCSNPTFGTSPFSDGEIGNVDASFFGIDVGVETGFVFGSMEQFDIGGRSTWLMDLDGTAQYGGSIFFGWAVL